MTTQVTTESGKVLEVEDKFNNNGKGAYVGEVIIKGESVHTYWFYDLKAKNISFKVLNFKYKGKSFDISGIVSQMSPELRKRLNDKTERELKIKEEEKVNRVSQMYQY